MNRTSADKIKLAAAFLVWFRRNLPQSLQGQIRPYLDRPYQLALNILDCCDSPQPLTVREIARSIGVAPETARQVLQALKEGGTPFAACPTRGWQTIRDHADSALPTALNPPLEFQETAPGYAAIRHG